MPMISEEEFLKQRDDEAKNSVWKYTGPDTLTLTLSRPLKVTPTSEPKTEIELSEPTIEQMSAYEDTRIKTRNNFDAGRKLIEKNSGLTEAEAKRLTMRDFEAALTFLTGFTTPPPEAGEI